MRPLIPEAGYRGITAFIVEKDFEGFTVGKKEDKLGIRASSTTELIFDNCKVPKENVLGEVGKGYKVSIETLNEGRIGIAAQMLGIAQGAFEAALNYTNEREQFGKRINEFQAVQFQLAEMSVEIEAARLLNIQRRPLERCRTVFLKRSRNRQTLHIKSRGKSIKQSHRAFRRLRLRQRLSGRKILARFQDRRDLRRHIEYAIADDCQINYERKITSLILIRSK